MIMGYESFAFTNLIGLSMGTINVGPNDLEKWYFEDLVKLCFTGFVISMVHLTYLSIFDVIMDIFYCHELKRVVSNEEIGPQNQDESFMNGRNLNVTSLIRESRQDIGNNSQILNDLIRDEQLLLENAINPLSISWLKYFVSSTSLLKNLQFVNLTNNEDLNELNLRNELFFSVNNSDIYYNKIKHNVCITCSLLSLRSMEFLISILIIIIIPFNANGDDMQWLHANTGNFNVSTYLHAIKNYVWKNDVAKNIVSNVNGEKSEINIDQFFWVIIAIFFIHEMLLFLVQKIITTPKSTQGEYLSENASSERIEMANSIEYIPYFRFI
ncbi:putative integral membrane protein [Cryptosporidium hominis]|nr:putative integral membrane protein [Cryptosporidium hominis]PPA64584.1 putative integral membrane protein [Cryptosporidium hominis]